MPHPHCAPETGQYCPPLMVGAPEPVSETGFLPATDDPKEFVRRLDEELRTTADAPTAAEGAESECELVCGKRAPFQPPFNQWRCTLDPGHDGRHSVPLSPGHFLWGDPEPLGLSWFIPIGFTSQ